LIHGLRESSERERLKSILLNGRESDDALSEVVDILRRAGSFEYALGRATSFTAVAHRELDRLPDIPARNALAEMADNFLHRKH